MSVTLRSARPDDEDFLFELFRQTMGDELAMLGDAILRMQFKAQLLTYSAQFPAAEHQIIMLDRVREPRRGHSLVARVSQRRHRENTGPGASGRSGPSRQAVSHFSRKVESRASSL